MLDPVADDGLAALPWIPEGMHVVARVLGEQVPHALGVAGLPCPDVRVGPRLKFGQVHVETLAGGRWRVACGHE